MDKKADPANYTTGLQDILDYHQATKHRPDRYAPGPGFMDWDNQPNPFREYDGAPAYSLPVLEPGETLRDLSYEAFYSAESIEPAPCDLAHIGQWLQYAMGLSAWKQLGPERWALRNNPSSGNLHPTEAYLVFWNTPSSGEDSALPAGIYHYNAYGHRLEQRLRFSASRCHRLQQLAAGAWGLVGLASVPWREAWKYGARALRYCQHDVGHAIGALSYSARLLNWQLSALPSANDDQLAHILGLDRDDDFNPDEREHPDLLLWWGPGDRQPRPDQEQELLATLGAAVDDARWQGRANTLSERHTDWPQIRQALAAAVNRDGDIMRPNSSPTKLDVPPFDQDDAPDSFARLIRIRRSAQQMDGVTGISFTQLERMLARTLPEGNPLLEACWPLPVQTQLMLYVHQVEGLAPGLYLLLRSPAQLQELLRACPGVQDRFVWERVENTALPLHRLIAPLDLRRVARQTSCFQDIAGDGAVAFSMVSALGQALREVGPWAYRRVHWETGLIGQILYLEAVACGIAATGIGCYFDDMVHQLLGLPAEQPTDWQVLYHFTIGGAVVDRRLTTLPPYQHLLRT